MGALSPEDTATSRAEIVDGHPQLLAPSSCTLYSRRFGLAPWTWDNSGQGPHNSVPILSDFPVAQ